MQVFPIFIPQLLPEKKSQCDFEDNFACESVIVRRAESVLHRLFTYDIFRPLFENLYLIHCLKILLWGILSPWQVRWAVCCVLSTWKSIWFIKKPSLVSTCYYYREHHIFRACVSFRDFKVEIMLAWRVIVLFGMPFHLLELLGHLEQSLQLHF